jgi:hypothetical protein
VQAHGGPNGHDTRFAASHHSCCAGGRI